MDFRKPFYSQSELPVIVYSTTTTADIIGELSDSKLSLSMDAADAGSSEYERIVSAQTPTGATGTTAQ